MSAGIGTDAGMSFGTAIALLKRGALVARRGWNGKGMWLRYVDLYNDPDFSVRENSTARGTWLPFIVMKTADNGLVPWLASQTDVLANDWVEVDDRDASDDLAGPGIGDLARIAFDAYGASTGGKTWDGKDIPPFAVIRERTPHVAKAWEAAVAAVLKELETSR